MTNCDILLSSNKDWMMMDIDTKILLGKRIRYLRKKAGLSQPALAAKCGWMAPSSQSRLSNYEVGKRDASLNDLNKIAIALKVSLEDLFKFDTPLEESNAKIISSPSSTKKIPDISWKFLDQFVKLKHLSFPHEKIEVDDTVSDDSFQLEVQGDSMVSAEESRDALYPGDKVIIDQKKEATSFNIVLVEINSEYWLRIYVPHGNYVELRPLNKNYAPVRLNEEAKIIGVVVERRRK